MSRSSLDGALQSSRNRFTSHPFRFTFFCYVAVTLLLIVVRLPLVLIGWEELPSVVGSSLALAVGVCGFLVVVVARGPQAQ